MEQQHPQMEPGKTLSQSEHGDDVPKGEALDDPDEIAGTPIPTFVLPATSTKKRMNSLWRWMVVGFLYERMHGRN